MNKKLLLTLALGAFVSNAFCVDEESAVKAAWFWKLFEEKELKKPFFRSIDPQCILPKLVPFVLQADIQANGAYQSCVKKTGNKKTCDQQRELAIHFHEILRPIMEGCAVSTKGEKPLGSDWFRATYR